MTRRSRLGRNVWVLRTTRDGCDVLRNGRQLRCDLTERAARRFVHQRMTEHDCVRLQEHDGYQRDITAAVGRAV